MAIDSLAKRRSVQSFASPLVFPQIPSGTVDRANVVHLYSGIALDEAATVTRTIPFSVSGAIDTSAASIAGVIDNTALSAMGAMTATFSEQGAINITPISLSGLIDTAAVEVSGTV